MATHSLTARLVYQTFEPPLAVRILGATPTKLMTFKAKTTKTKPTKTTPTKVKTKTTPNEFKAKATKATPNEFKSKAIPTETTKNIRLTSVFPGDRTAWGKKCWV
eukprot:Rmarinus@m.9458